jgi:salicylate hydroxylase
LTVRNILIIGAGMGGLTTALSFARAGHEVHLVEQAPALSEVGAGLQVSPNASRILIGLGLGEALQRAMVHPHEIVLASGGSLRKITHVPCGAFAAERWGAPYGVMHRADLQTLLLDAVNAQPNCHLHLGQRISSTGIGELANRLGMPRPDLVVGADGVWSEIRTLIKGAPSPRFFRSGRLAVQGANRCCPSGLEPGQCHRISRTQNPPRRLPAREGKNGQHGGDHPR